MTLRLALLLISLIIISIIGLYCHLKFRRANPKKRSISINPSVSSEYELEHDVDAPFFRESVNSDLPEQSDGLFNQVDISLPVESETHELSSSFDELNDKKRIAQRVAKEFLPTHADNDLVTQYWVVLPNVMASAKKVNNVVSLLSKEVSKPVSVFAKTKASEDFLPIESFSAKDKIIHLKTSLPLKDRKGFADLKLVDSYHHFVDKIAGEFGCERVFDEFSEQIENKISELKNFIKDNDSIIIMYILAQPDDSFDGASMQTAFESAGLIHGDYDFFHYFEAESDNDFATIFSLANLYKPGSFNLDEMDRFSTMGLCAFLVPSLLNDPITGFKHMCNSCKLIADNLNGVLTTNQRELMDEQNYLEICKQINSHLKTLNDKGIQSGDDVAKRLFS